jgi:hypothetical protein
MPVLLVQLYLRTPATGELHCRGTCKFYFSEITGICAAPQATLVMRSADSDMKLACGNFGWQLDSKPRPECGESQPRAALLADSDSVINGLMLESPVREDHLHGNLNRDDELEGKIQVLPVPVYLLVFSSLVPEELWYDFFLRLKVRRRCCWILVQYAACTAPRRARLHARGPVAGRPPAGWLSRPLRVGVKPPACNPPRRL